MIRSSLIAVVVIGVVFASCAGGATGVETSYDDPDIIRAPTVIAVTGVDVIPMTSAQRLESQTVIISNGRVQSIGPTATTPLPAGANVIEGRGRILAPALIDMHVHLRRAELPLYFRAGVTTVRNMWGHAAVLSMKRAIADDTLVGPTVHSTSNGFDANPPQWPYTRRVL